MPTDAAGVTCSHPLLPVPVTAPARGCALSGDRKGCFSPVLLSSTRRPHSHSLSGSGWANSGKGISQAYSGRRCPAQQRQAEAETGSSLTLQSMFTGGPPWGEWHVIMAGKTDILETVYVLVVGRLLVPTSWLATC